METLADDDQFTILGSIFHNFTGEKPSGRFGSHWEKIGFQVLFKVIVHFWRGNFGFGK